MTSTQTDNKKALEYLTTCAQIHAQATAMRDEAIAGAFRAGISQVQIAKASGISASGVRLILARVSAPSRENSSWRARLAAKLLAAGNPKT